MEVTSQNSLHCTAAIERLDTDTAPGLSIQLSGNYTEVTWSRKVGEEPEEEEGVMGDNLEANGQGEVGLMAGCERRHVGRPVLMERDRQ